MKNADLTVIIPTYNRAHFLDRAITSALNQTLACKEIIIVDDGSTDNTAEVVAGKAQKSKIPILYIAQENQGPSAARNLGVAHSSAKYIAFLDSDDHWQKQKIKKQYSALLLHPKYRISHTYEKWLRRGEHLNQKKKHIPRHGDIFDHCLSLCAVGMSTVMLEKSLFNEIGLFDESMRCCEDYDFWLRVSCLHPFLLVDERLTIKEGGREDQVSYQYRVGMDRLRIDALVRLLKAGALNQKQAILCKKEIQRKAKIFGIGALKHDQQELGEQYLHLVENI